MVALQHLVDLGAQGLQAFLQAGLLLGRVVGQELSMRADVAYAETLRHDVLEAAASKEPVYRRLVVSIEGVPWDYDRIACTEPADTDGSRIVVTLPRVLRAA